MNLYLDTETYSEVPIKNGTYVYAESCEMMIITWAFDDGPVHTMDLTDADRALTASELLLWETLRSSNCTVTAHNSMFDRNVLKYALGIDIPIERWRDTMVKAYLHGLPGKLDLLCDILKVPQDKAKLKEESKLIHLFCKPQPFKFSQKRADFPSAKLYREAKALAEANWTGRATRETHPEQWQKFLAYAAADIEAMRAVDKRMPKWNYDEGKPELALWHLDQWINDRGMYVDQDLARRAVQLVKDRKAELRDEIEDQTEGALVSAMQREPLLAYLLEAYGVSLPNLQKSTLQRRIDDPDLPDELKELLRIRLQSSSTAVSKYTSLLKAVSADGRLRGTKQFAGAIRTARWAGRTFQPDNLPRPGMNGPDGKPVHPDYVDEWIDIGIEALQNNAADLIVPDLIGFASSAIRKVVSAAPGNKLVIADYANIEGRGLAYLAGEEWKLQAFRDYDAGIGDDLYKLAYARAFAMLAADVDKLGRQIGKVMELMLGFEGGVGAFLTGAATYKIDLGMMAEKARPSIPGDVWEEAENFYNWLVDKGASTFGLSKFVFCVCDSLKRLWRRAHPRIASLWRELKDTVIEAIENPGVTLRCRVFKIRRDGSWLRIVLPSGRALCYPFPQVNNGQISYMGLNQYTRKWERINTHGGKLAENLTQAFARDILAYNMPAVEAAGYPIVLHVHDENVTETPDTDEYSSDELCSVMSVVPNWAEGLPLAAAGFETYRYRKD